MSHSIFDQKRYLEAWADVKRYESGKKLLDRLERSGPSIWCDLMIAKFLLGSFFKVRRFTKSDKAAAKLFDKLCPGSKPIMHSLDGSADSGVWMYIGNVSYGSHYGDTPAMAMCTYLVRRFLPENRHKIRRAS